MSHGGRLSITEAIANAVPLIVVPLFAEQEFNSFRIERLNRGIRLEISTLTLAELEHALTEITTNPRCKRNMVEAKKLFDDRPSTPLETAVWCTEYVLRQDDTSSLKPLSIDQSWYERRWLDVCAFILLINLTIAFTVGCIITIVF